MIRHIIDCFRNKKGELKITDVLIGILITIAIIAFLIWLFTSILPPGDEVAKNITRISRGLS